MRQNTAVVNERETDRPEASVLDRRVDVSSISWLALGGFGVLALAAIIRLVGWTAWPLSPREAGIATDALALVHGEAVSAEAWAQPMATSLVALSLFLFGPTDGAVRLISVLAGLGSILLLLGLAPWFGRRAMLGAAFIAAVSPTLSFGARRVDGGGLLVFGSLLLLLCILRWADRPVSGRAAMAGFATAFLVLSGPLGWIALMLTVLASLALAPVRVGRLTGTGTAVLTFLVTILLISTSSFSRPGGFTSFVHESFGALWANHLATIGERWFLVPYQIITDEPLALVLAVYALISTIVWPARSATGTHEASPALGLGTWAAAAAFLTLLLGGKAGDLFSLAVLPVVLLAGYGLSRMISRVDWLVFTTGQGVIFIITLFLTAAALASTFGLIFGEGADDTFRWLVSFLILVLLILGPLLGLAIWLGRRLPAQAAPVIGLVAVLFLSIVVIRSSVLLGSPNLDRPGQILTAGSTTAGVVEMHGRLDRLSRDLTTFVTDVRDPTGGHGLTITVDESIEQPFRWYFRNYPNLVVVDPALAAGEQGFPQVIFTSPGNAHSLVPDEANYEQRSHPLLTTLPETLDEPNWADFARSVVNLNEWRHFGSYLIDRQTAQPAQPGSYVLALREDVAAFIYGTSAPQ